ncbi:hypothetical protein BDM02DRAFT_3130759 [Thelephora ganbajun]|uniref:Uncharacterized protein n=1 Tax=Thelephora ganbajun TaxID=370292 RepID=A0ACB6Z853_THEGA|nr:hypothetical protein BDM02DRAFT_3130759 [Thelephora ganbajun]
MGTTDFAVRFDPTVSSLIKTSTRTFSKARRRRCKVPFKGHKDIPRDTGVLGSLVIIYPASHEDEELALRHKDREWTFDPNTLASLDVIEQEVLKVTSGSRTRDLRSVHHSSISVAFDARLQGTVACLRREGAHVYQSYRELELEPFLRMMYSQRWSRSKYRPSHGVVVEVIVKNPNYHSGRSDHQRCRVEELGGIPVNPPNGVLAVNSDWNEDEFTESYERLTWLTDFVESAKEPKKLVLAYGDGVPVGYVYRSPCPILDICPAGNRA